VCHPTPIQKSNQPFFIEMISRFHISLHMQVVKLANKDMSLSKQREVNNFLKIWETVAKGNIIPFSRKRRGKLAERSGVGILEVSTENSYCRVSAGGLE
jgi:hypothetical protein